jgi:hypothetical protein
VRELSLHLLDLIENSIRAQASIIDVAVSALPAEDRLTLVIEDNGNGLQVSPEQALNPFYTTKSGKRTGLGLSLFKAAAEQAGGCLALSKSALGTPKHPGLKVTVQMRLGHVDRSPLGDLAGTLSAMVCTNPEIDFRFHLRLDRRAWDVRVFDLADELGVDRQDSLVIARGVMDRLTAELQEPLLGL